MTNEEIAKRTVYEFKKFARSKHFWEEYKRLSSKINGVDGLCSPMSFVDICKDYEPVKLIQSSTIFCTWPDIETQYSGETWSVLSSEWAYFCLMNGLFYNENTALEYVSAFISTTVVENYIKNKKQVKI